jgi:hypothetical protein
MQTWKRQGSRKKLQRRHGIRRWLEKVAEI